MSDEVAGCGWVKLYHPSGVLVTLPVTASPLDYAALLRNVGGMLAAGFLPSAPGTEPGEHKEEVGYVVRRTKEGRHGPVPVLDLYPAHEATKFAALTVYLDTPEDAAAFERASGMRAEVIPEYIGDNKIERGKNPKTDRLVVKAPRPFGVIWRDNPRYDEAEAEATRAKGAVYGVPKRKFVRWADAAPAAAIPAAQPEAGPDPAAEARKEIAAITSLPILAAYWDTLPADLQAAVREDKDRRKAAIQAAAPKPQQPPAGRGELFNRGRAPVATMPD